MLKVNCNCDLIPGQSHFKNQCDKIARAQREAQRKARNDAPLSRTTTTQAKSDLEKACHGSRGVTALAKSCFVKKDGFKKIDVEIASTRASSTHAASVEDIEEMHKTIVLETRKSVIMEMRLPEKQANELRKNLRTLYEIQVAEQAIAKAEKEGKKCHPNLAVKVARKASLVADPLVQRFRRTGGIL